jgi:hypothetical protein
VSIGFLVMLLLSSKMTTLVPFVDIASLSMFLESIGSHNVDLIFTPQSKLKQGALLLYHYTDLTGLIGILKRHDLWLTNSRYSNDAEEMVHGTNVAKKVIESAVRAQKYDAQYLTELTQLTSQQEGVYISCFCEKDNLLSQWRGYGAYGSGVSLQFAPKEFADVTGPDNLHGLLRFWKVFYNPLTQTEIIERALEHYAPNNPHNPLNSGQTPAALARKAADAIRFFIPTFKNADFQEEDEWRLIFTPAPGIMVRPQFRVSHNMLVPYYSLRDLINPGSLPLLPLRQVCIGPSVHKQLNAESVKALIEEAGYTAVPVIVSNTSYRA